MATKNIFKPILFNTEMVQAILAGRKTQTRRIIKLDTGQLIADTVEQISSNYFFFKKDNEAVAGRNSKYQIDDILWVRETFVFIERKNKNFYRADNDSSMKLFSGWKPSLFMPKEAARIFLKVTNVRCERLQDISEEDAIAEGIIKCFVGNPTDFENSKMRVYRSSKLEEGNVFAIDAFKELWQSINAKKHPWKSNPWVWVYDFEVIDKPEDFN